VSLSGGRLANKRVQIVKSAVVIPIVKSIRARSPIDVDDELMDRAKPGTP
jgi:hypothetical protein